MWHRRKWLALLVFVIPVAAIVGATRTLPSIYESTATVLIEHHQMPQGLGGPSAAGELEMRLRTVSQQILSRSRMDELITRFNLYPEMRAQETLETVVEQMRQDVALEFKEVREPTGQGATIAFSLRYRGRDPDTVARVTNALAALYVEENARVRERQTAGTTEFLRVQLEDAKRQLEEQEQQIGDFKDRHIGELPEQQAANLAALERLNGQLRVVSDKELRAMERRDELTKQLAELPGSGDTISARLAKLRQELADLRTHYTDEHPDVVRVKQEIAALEREFASARGGRSAENPAVRQLRNALAGVEAELATLRSQEQMLRRVIATYEQRVENAPRREQELQQRTRDYAAAKERYQSLLQRYEDAQLAERMDQRLQDEQFTVLDSAVAAEHPVAPRRMRILLMGLMLSAGVAVGAALLAETRDTSFHTVDDVRAFTSVPVLVSIPPIVIAADARRRRLRFGLVALVVGLGAAAVGVGSAYLARSNDVLVRLLTPGRF